MDSKMRDLTTPVARAVEVTSASATPCPASRDRSLRGAIRSSLQTGRTTLALRLAEAASRLPRMSPSLAEAVMRVRLSNGQPRAALAASDRASRLSPPLHLSRAAALLQLGQWLEAHLELADAHARCQLCPRGLELLAHLELQVGDRTRFRALMHEMRAAGRERQALCLLVCDAVSAGEMAHARELAAPLHAHAAFPCLRQFVLRLLGSLRLCPGGAAPHPASEHASRLAEELIRRPAALPLLFEAQRRAFDAPSARLLQRALDEAASKMIDPVPAHAALVELTLELDGPIMAAERLSVAIAAYPMAALLRNMQPAIDDALMHVSQPPARATHREHDVLAVIGVDEPEHRALRERAA